MANKAFEKIDELLGRINSAVIDNGQDLESFRIEFLGTKNSIKPLFSLMKDIEENARKEFGAKMNDLKMVAQEKFDQAQQRMASALEVDRDPFVDMTAPSLPLRLGSKHPVSLVLNRIVSIFSRIGFVVAEEREIEDDWHNFTAMNTPEHHPARDMQDTFYLKDSTKYLLRTHTSSVQARMMTTQKPPIRIIAPGRVYRNETISSRSHCQFHQVEGLYVDKNVSFADMKKTLMYYAQEMYGKDVRVRLRPSYFPFTEPSAEMDVYWGLNNERDYRITKGTGWLEIMGCGMVDPAVLANCGIDPEEYSGYAFGMGIERQAMLQYRISDIRQLFENDIRFLSQFSTAL